MASGSNLFYRSVTIDISADDDLSDGIHLGDAVLVGIVIPSTWTTADITFQASIDDTTYGPVYDQYGTQVTVTTPAASRFITIDPAALAGAEYIKLATSAAQAADRTLNLVLKQV